MTGIHNQTFFLHPYNYIIEDEMGENLTSYVARLKFTWTKQLVEITDIIMENIPP